MKCTKEATALEQSKDIYKKEYREVKIKTTAGELLKGRVNIGLKARVADLFTKTDDPFIVLSDVESGSGSKRVLFVNKNNIVWVEPEE
jgi:hypothetical protein